MTGIEAEKLFDQKLALYREDKNILCLMIWLRDIICENTERISPENDNKWVLKMVGKIGKKTRSSYQRICAERSYGSIFDFCFGLFSEALDFKNGEFKAKDYRNHGTPTHLAISRLFADIPYIEALGYMPEGKKEIKQAFGRYIVNTTPGKNALLDKFADAYLQTLKGAPS